MEIDKIWLKSMFKFGDLLLNNFASTWRRLLFNWYEIRKKGRNERKSK
jgi:hypothetical protein